MTTLSPYAQAQIAANALCPTIEGKRRNRNSPGYDEAYKAFAAVADSLIPRSSGDGPDISHMLRIVPVVQRDARLWYIKPVDPHGQAFTWDPKPSEPADNLSVVCRIYTLHRYGYYGFFKPSIAEVLAQIPTEVAQRVVAFETDGPDDADDLNEDLFALDAGFHVAETTLYERTVQR